MKAFLTFAIALASTLSISAQNTQQDSINNPNNQVNTAQRILNGNINTKGVTVGGYGELTYNRKEDQNA
jgi:hypothetical protein